MNNPVAINNDFKLLEENITNIDNTYAYKLVYSALNPEGFLLKNMTLLTIKNNKLYDVTFSALNKTYNSFLPSIQKAVGSLKLINSSSSSGSFETNLAYMQKNNTDSKANHSDNNRGPTHKQISSYGKQNYEFGDVRIRVQPPFGWSKEETVDKDNNKLIIFKSPFSDKRSKDPSYHETTITMAIAIESPQHSGVTDYRVMYSKEKESNSNNDNKWHWVTKVMEVSANDKTRILEKTNSSDFFDEKYQNPPGYALFSFNLSKINYPQQYRVVFYITDYFVLSHIYCRLVDTTNWIMVPPPEFEISANPNSLTLRPGQESNVEMNIKGKVDLPTQAYYASNYVSNNGNSENEQDRKNSELQTYFIQNNISIPPSGTGTSTLKVKVPDSFDAGNKESLTIPVSANISFPTTIINRGGESFSNSKSQSITAASNLTLTVLPSYTPEERLNNFVDTWITPISGMWTFLAGVAAVLTPIIIKIYNKKKKSDPEKQSS